MKRRSFLQLGAATGGALALPSAAFAVGPEHDALERRVETHRHALEQTFTARGILAEVDIREGSKPWDQLIEASAHIIVYIFPEDADPVGIGRMVVCSRWGSTDPARDNDVWILTGAELLMHPNLKSHGQVLPDDQLPYHWANELVANLKRMKERTVAGDYDEWAQGWPR